MNKTILIMAGVSVVLLAVLIIAIAVAKSYAKKYVSEREKRRGYENIIDNLTKKGNIKAQIIKEAASEKSNISGDNPSKFNATKRAISKLRDNKIHNDDKPRA